MTKEQTRRYEMLVRVRDFGVAQADLFPKPSLAHDTFKTVSDAVEQLNAHTVTKLSSAQGTMNKGKARAGLHDLVDRIAQTGRVIAAHDPNLAEKFALGAHLTDQDLLMRARVVVSAAESMKQAFIARLLPKTFLADLDAAIAAFEAAIHERQAGKNQRREARTHIKEALKAGSEAADALDAMVANRLGGDPATMAVWRENRRISYPSKRSHAAVEAAADASSSKAA